MPQATGTGIMQWSYHQGDPRLVMEQILCQGSSLLSYPKSSARWQDSPLDYEVKKCWIDGQKLFSYESGNTGWLGLSKLLETRDSDSRIFTDTITKYLVDVLRHVCLSMKLSHVSYKPYMLTGTATQYFKYCAQSQVSRYGFFHLGVLLLLYRLCIWGLGSTVI